MSDKPLPIREWRLSVDARGDNDPPFLRFDAIDSDGGSFSLSFDPSAYGESEDELKLAARRVQAWGNAIERFAWGGRAGRHPEYKVGDIVPELELP